MTEERIYFADTSFLIDLMNSKQEAIEIFENSDTILTGTIPLFELEKKGQINAEEIKDAVEPFSLRDAEKASELYRDLEQKGDKINQIDYLIAAQALNRNLTLLTLDRDFQKIEPLNVKYYRDLEKS